MSICSLREARVIYDINLYPQPGVQVLALSRCGMGQGCSPDTYVLGSADPACL